MTSATGHPALTHTSGEYRGKGERRNWKTNRQASQLQTLWKLHMACMQLCDVIQGHKAMHMADFPFDVTYAQQGHQHLSFQKQMNEPCASLSK